MWPFKKKISQPILAIVEAINNDEFKMTQEDGVLSFWNNEYHLRLKFWAGGMFDSGWCTEDETDLLCETAYAYKRKQDKIAADKVRESFMKLVKEK